jgi:hypothetical protein
MLGDIEGPGFYVSTSRHQLSFALLMMCIASYGLGGKYSPTRSRKRT